MPGEIINPDNVESPTIPDAYICPISREIMLDPVINEVGQTYERICIEKWLINHMTDPYSRHPLSSSKLIPNIALKNLIQNFIAVNPKLKIQVLQKQYEMKYLKGDHEEALQLVKQVLNIEPDNIEALLKKILILQHSFTFNDLSCTNLLEECAAALNKNSRLVTNINFLKVRANALSYTLKHEEALQDYEAMVNLDPTLEDNIEFLTERASFFSSLYLFKKNVSALTSEIKDLNHCLELNPDEDDRMNLLAKLAEAYYENLEYNKSLTTLFICKDLEIGPDEVETLLNTAIQILDDYNDKQKNIPLNYFKELLICLDKWITQFPEVITEVTESYNCFYRARGELYSINGLYQEAIADFDTDDKENGARGIATLRFRGLNFLRMGKYEEALQYYLRLRKANNEMWSANDVITVNSLIERGLVYEHLQQFENALNAYKEAKLLDINIENNALFLHQRGRAYIGLKLWQEARKNYNEAKALNPNLLTDINFSNQFNIILQGLLSEHEMREKKLQLEPARVNATQNAAIAFQKSIFEK